MSTPTETRLAALEPALQQAPPDGVVSLYLFGSHARGRAHRESDIDLAVLFDRQSFPSSRDRFDARLALWGWLSDRMRSDAIDLVVLNDAPPLLARHIVCDGRRLFTSDTERDHAFRRDVQLLAADLAPFVEKARRRRLEALARP